MRAQHRVRRSLYLRLAGRRRPHQPRRRHDAVCRPASDAGSRLASERHRAPAQRLIPHRSASVEAYPLPLPPPPLGGGGCKAWQGEAAPSPDWGRGVSPLPLPPPPLGERVAKACQGEAEPSRNGVRGIPPRRNSLLGLSALGFRRSSIV